MHSRENDSSSGLFDHSMGSHNILCRLIWLLARICAVERVQNGMEVGRKRGISRKMQAKDALNARARKACRAGCFFLPSPRPLAIRRRFRPMQQQQAPPASSSQAGATNAEASCARSQGADYHGQTIHPPNSTTTTTTLLPPNRPSVAVYPAPLLCRLLLEIHCHNPATSSTSIYTSNSAKRRKHVRQDCRSYSLQPAPCFHPTAGASTECAVRIARSTGRRGATE